MFNVDYLLYYFRLNLTCATAKRFMTRGRLVAGSVVMFTSPSWSKNEVVSWPGEFTFISKQFVLVSLSMFCKATVDYSIQ